MSGSRHTVAAWAAAGALVAAPLICLGAVAPSAHAARHRAKACASHAGHHARSAKRASRRARCASARGRFLAHRIAIDPSAFHNPFTAPATPLPAPAVPTPAAPVAAPAATATPAPAPTPTGGTGRAVQVQGREFALTLSRPEVVAGSVTVEFNTYPAEDPHSLVLVNEDGSGPVYRFDEQPARSVVDKRLTLSRGTWLLFCDVADHQAKGMTTELTVR